MTTFWQAMPSESEFELWWLVEAEDATLGRVAGLAGCEVERAAEVVERVETFLQNAARRAEDFAVRRRPRGGKWDAAARVVLANPNDLETLAAWAAWQLLDSLCERPTVRVKVREGRGSEVHLSQRKRRPSRQSLLSVIRLGRLVREGRLQLAARP